MDRGIKVNHSKSRPIRNLLLFVVAFTGGIECFRLFRFTIPVLNYFFALAVLCIPLFALRPVVQLPRVPRVIGLILVSPILLFSLLMIAVSISCDLDLHPYTTHSCLQELDRTEQGGF